MNMSKYSFWNILLIMRKCLLSDSSDLWFEILSDLVNFRGLRLEYFQKFVWSWESTSNNFFLLFCPFSYIIEQGVCYLVLCEAAFPKKLAFAYLEDLHSEFDEQHGKKVPTVSRPYSFIEFGKFLLLTSLSKEQIIWRSYW